MGVACDAVSIQTVMSGVSIAQPDVTLLLDLQGVIRNVTLSEGIGAEDVQTWLGRPWPETVGDANGVDVRQLVDDARTSGVSAFRQIAQRFPSGRELPMEYTAVRLGGDAGLLAIGKSVQAVAELQSRLIAAQHAMERDYWKLREIETRYRVLFDASNEAVLLVAAASLRIVEANPAAMRALGLAPAGRDLFADVALPDHEPLRNMLLRVREHGRAPGVLVHLGVELKPWLFRASLITAEAGPVFLLQLAAVGASDIASGPRVIVPVENLMDRVPDGFVVVDPEGSILLANQAFLDLAQIGAEGLAVGERLGRWIGRPGADLPVLLAKIRKHGVVRLFTTTLQGELGTDAEVEISAVMDDPADPQFVAMLLHDVTQRLPAPLRRNGLDQLFGLSNKKTSLRSLVRASMDVMERRFIEEALDQTHGNRTAAAELLGLSRQSLYAKLGRYGLDGNVSAAAGTGD